MPPTPPIILIGMHRSGTTLLTNLLEDLGVFVGLRGGTNREAKLFKYANKWIFSQVGAIWDRPENAAFSYSPRFIPHVDRVLLGQIRGLRTAAYLGLPGALRYRDLRRVDFPWAWKDPRNCFTVGHWKRIFPEAKLVHVYRHPLDVASSLLRREEKRYASFSPSFRTYVAEQLLRRDQLYCHSFRLFDPLEGVALWQQYVEAGFEGCAPFEQDTIHCRYEDLLTQPEESLGEIALHLGLEIKPDALARAMERVNPDRGYAFERDPTMVSLAEEISTLPLVQKLGYQTEAKTDTRPQVVQS